MLVSQGGEKVSIPHEPGEWMILRGLNWWNLKRASDERSKEARASLAGMTPEMQEAIDRARERRGETEAAAAAAIEADPFLSYDKGVVLELGIVGWSYPYEVTVENVHDLDETTAAWAGREIVARSRIQEPERGKSSGSSEDTTERSPNGSAEAPFSEPVIPPSS